jgi:hypothetical protein
VDRTGDFLGLSVWLLTSGTPSCLFNALVPIRALGLASARTLAELLNSLTGDNDCEGNGDGDGGVTMLVLEEAPMATQIPPGMATSNSPT